VKFNWVFCFFFLVDLLWWERSNPLWCLRECHGWTAFSHLSREAERGGKGQFLVSWGSCLSALFWVSGVFGSVVPEQRQNRRGRRALWENNGKERKKERKKGGGLRRTMNLFKKKPDAKGTYILSREMAIPENPSFTPRLCYAFVPVQESSCVSKKL
jgi:hypothetical protein